MLPIIKTPTQSKLDSLVQKLCGHPLSILTKFLHIAIFLEIGQNYSKPKFKICFAKNIFSNCPPLPPMVCVKLL